MHAGTVAERRAHHILERGQDVIGRQYRILARLAYAVAAVTQPSTQPHVLGLGSMIAAPSGPSLALSASASTWPLGLAGTSSTVKPAKAAVAGLVPWADSGTRMRLRFSPRAAIAARMASRPHNSPWAPALGDIATAGLPVRVGSQFMRLEIN